MKRLFGLIAMAFLMAWAFAPPPALAGQNIDPFSVPGVAQSHQVVIDAQVAPVDHSVGFISPISQFWPVANVVVSMEKNYPIDLSLYDTGIGLFPYNNGTTTLLSMKTTFVDCSNSNVSYRYDTALNNSQNLSNKRLYEPVLHKRPTYRRTKFLMKA